MGPKRAGRAARRTRILPPPCKLTAGDPYWDDMILPADFRQHIEQSVFMPMERFDEPDDNGIIIFGPPGTGKTTVVKSIANQLGWKFYSIGPHNLVREGMTPEAAMKQCFEEIRKTVEAAAKSGMARIVFFFDEIDEIVVSREGGSDRQSRLATTMMLPVMQELADLARRHRFLYFIATNHIERFDSAITRPGRIDLVLPLGPPDRPARVLLFGRFMAQADKRAKKRHNTAIRMGATPASPRGIEATSAADMNALSVVSEGLTMWDIKSVCMKASESRISSLPHVLGNPDVRSSTNISTSRLTEWVHKYQAARDRRELEKFESDRERYTRGSALYAGPHTVHEKVGREFSSLRVNHNLFEGGRKWKAGSRRKIVFSFHNLSAHNAFIGSISVSLHMGGRRVAYRPGTEIVRIGPGVTSQESAFDFTPDMKGRLKVVFEIGGKFALLGVGAMLRRNIALLEGTAVTAREVIVR